MIKTSIAFIFLKFSFVSNVFSQIDSALLPRISPRHYESEYTLDRPACPKEWMALKPGLHAGFGSEDKLYLRTEVPKIQNEGDIWAATGWKGERLNAQIVVWSRDSLEQVRFKINDLKNERGKLLRKETIQLNEVCYVFANYPYGAEDANCSQTPYRNGFLMPDRFQPFEQFDVPANTVRPVWASCNIPADADAGTYRGAMEVMAKSGDVVLNVEIKVQNRLLPKPENWHYRLDLWQNPWIVADYNHVKPWGDEHKELLKKHLKLYADAGGTYITTYGVYSPWGDNEYAIERDMIKWIKSKDGSWRFDYHIFDQYVELAMSIGIYKAITIYTPLPWGERFRYMDESTGNYVFEQWPPTSNAFKVNWSAFLTDLEAHLDKKGWFNKTYIGINENDMQQTLAAIKMIKAHSSRWKITYAGNWHRELDTLLDDYSILYGNEASVDEVKARASRGQTTTYYVSCNPAKPNNFLFSPPIEARWMGWYSAAHGYSGFLRWAYDSWPEDPMRDARYGSWPAGDSYLVYPGGNSCIRFEKLREGIVDYEKIWILKALALKSSDKAIENGVTALKAYLETLNAEKAFDEEKVMKVVERGRKMVDELSEKF